MRRITIALEKCEFHGLFGFVKAGTTEGDFEVQWQARSSNSIFNLKDFLSFFLSQGDFFYGKNLAIATKNNEYLDGLGAVWLPQFFADGELAIKCLETAVELAE